EKRRGEGAAEAGVVVVIGEILRLQNELNAETRRRRGKRRDRRPIALDDDADAARPGRAALSKPERIREIAVERPLTRRVLGVAAEPRRTIVEDPVVVVVGAGADGIAASRSRIHVER